MCYFIKSIKISNLINLRKIKNNKKVDIIKLKINKSHL
jgi:hypothetical protein